MVARAHSPKTRTLNISPVLKVIGLMAKSPQSRMVSGGDPSYEPLNP